MFAYAIKAYINCSKLQRTYFQGLKLHKLARRFYFTKGASSTPSTIQKNHLPNEPFKKILVANRGVTASRIIRTCCELDIPSVAIYSQCDSKQPYRNLANESYLVGKNKSPADAYTDYNEIIKIAKESCADAIHPGTGLLAQRSDFAEAVFNADLTFIGPPPSVLYQMGDKVKARKIASEAGIPVVPGIDEATNSLEDLENFATKYGFPVILKPVYGGGGIAISVAHKIEDLRAAFKSFSKQALKRFGDGSLYIEKCISKPRLIEVQLLADAENNVVHLLERDSSLQKDFRNYVSIAPAPFIDDKLRHNIIEAAVSFAKCIKYQSVGSVEFLVDEEGQFYFSEISCQLQRDHCVTEEVTGIDLVRKQIQIAEGRTLCDIGIEQENIEALGVSVHCAITTEDPAKNLAPDFGFIQRIRYPEGIGVRVDGSNLHAGSFISSYYGSNIMRLTTKAPTLKESVARMKRTLREIGIRGVKSNIPFLLHIMSFPELLDGKISTFLIEEKSCSIGHLKLSKRRDQKILEYLSDVLVNGPVTLVPFLSDGVKPVNIKVTLPELEQNICPDGLRQLLKEHGAYWFTEYIRERKNVILCDTTIGNAQQSLLASRLRTYDIVKIAPYISQNFGDFYALDNWGGETFVTCLQHLYECPWKRVKAMREAIPNIPFLMTIRGPNLVGYTNYPDNVLFEFCKTAVDCGIDMFQVCDPLNYIPNIELCIKAVKQAGGLVEAAVMYTGDISSPRETKFNLDYYMFIIEQLVKAGTHVITIKDIAGLLRPQAADILVSKIREKFCSIPIHVQTRDSSGFAVASTIAAAVAGADIVDVAADPMSGLTAQPNMGAVIASLQNTDLDTGIDPNKIYDYNSYWQDVRHMYAPYDSSSYMKASDFVFNYHEIPGSQYSHLFFQTVAAGLHHQFRDVQKAYHDANLILGDIIKDMPAAKAVGDLAMYMVQKGLSLTDIEEKADKLKLPESLIQYLQGSMGKPDYGFPDPFRHKALKDKPCIDESTLPPMNLIEMKKNLQKKHKHIYDFDVISSALFPEYAENFLAFREKYDGVDRLNTKIFLVGPDHGEEFEVELSQGNVASIKLLGISTFTNESSERLVIFDMNGEPRFIYVKDNAEIKKRGRQKANPCIEGQIPAPKSGRILDIKVKIGDTIQKEQVLALISSRKSEFSICSPVSGEVTDVLLQDGSLVQEGDLMFIVDTSKDNIDTSLCEETSLVPTA